MQPSSADDPLVAALSAKISYPNSFHPETRLDPAEMFQVFTCYDQWFQIMDRSRVEDARLVGAWLKDAMEDYGRGFELLKGHLVFTGTSSCYFPPLLARCTEYNEDFLTLLLLLINDKFEGESVFSELLRTAKVWREDGRSFKPEVHHARPENCLDGTDSKGLDTGGIYVHLTPEIGTKIKLKGVAASVKYAGDDHGNAAKKVDRRQVNIGQTYNFQRREAQYSQTKGWTNDHHKSARLQVFDGKEYDTIGSWTRKVLIQVPAVTPRGTAITALFRRVIETVLNIAYGATRGKKRVWGLQTTAIDSEDYELKIGDEEICEFFIWYSGNIASKYAWSEVGDCSGVKGYVPPMWPDITQKYQELQLQHHQAKWSGIEAHLVPPPRSVCTRDTIIKVLQQKYRKQSPVTMPMIPMEHWGSLATIPTYWVQVYEERELLPAGSLEDRERALDMMKNERNTDWNKPKTGGTHGLSGFKRPKRAEESEGGEESEQSSSSSSSAASKVRAPAAETHKRGRFANKKKKVEQAKSD